MHLIFLVFHGKLGRFVLASNDLEIDDETMLQHYKGQQSVERGFRFLKDKRFNIAQVYLKKEERIQALAMIMVLTLLVYSIAEWLLRKRLMETGNSIPNQLKKPTQKPTLKWVCIRRSKFDPPRRSDFDPLRRLT